MQVIVVGAGIAGLTIASQLAEAGCDVVACDAGASVDAGHNIVDAPMASAAGFISADDARWHVTSAPAVYEWLRVRAVGGRGTVWGGWCARSSAADAIPACWNMSPQQWSDRYDAAEAWLQCTTAPLPEFASRVQVPFSQLLRPKMEAQRDFARPALWPDWSPRITIQSNTIITQLEYTGAGYALHGYCGRDIVTLTAPRVVLAASAWETARLLHGLAHTQSPAWAATIGQGISDHIRLSMLCIYERDPAAPIPPLLGGWLPAGTVPHVPRWFFELRGPWPAAVLTARDQQRLRITDPSRYGVYALHGLGEAAACAQRFLTFDPTQHDALHRPQMQIHWDWQPHERDDIARATEHLQQWAAQLANGPHRCVLVRDPYRPGGTGHEAGGAVAHATDVTAVCDAHSAVREFPGLHVADSASWPEPLTTYPTLSVVARAQQVAAQIASSDVTKRVALQ